MHCFFHHHQKNYGVVVKSSIHLRKDLVTLNLDHLWLLYFPRESSIFMINYVTEQTHDPDGIILGVDVDDSQHPYGLHIKIKNLGFRWVYKQDIEGLMCTMTPRGSSSIQIHDDLGMGTPILSLESGNWSE